MTPEEEITEANWVQAMDSMAVEPSTLTSAVRDGIDDTTRGALEAMRSRVPERRLYSHVLHIDGVETVVHPDGSTEVRHG